MAICVKFSAEELLLATKGFFSNEAISISNIILDSREVCSQADLFIPIVGDRFDAHNFIIELLNGADKPGIICINESYYNSNVLPEYNYLIVPDTTVALQDLANFHRNRLSCKVIAITGSNGKTSTKDICYSLTSNIVGEQYVYATKKNTNNHIGVPINLLSLSEEHRFSFIELGTNHPGEIETLAKIVQPDISLITNIGASHLEFFKSRENVAKEKSSIYKYMKDGGVAITDNAVLAYLKDLPDIPNIVINSDELLSIKYLSSNLNETSFELCFNDNNDKHLLRWNVLGKHQLINLKNSIAILHSLGFEKSEILNSIANVQVSSMRLELIVEKGVNWVNDAYNANPDSTLSTIDFVCDNGLDSDSNLLILGDMLELGDMAYTEHYNIIEYLFTNLKNIRLAFVGKYYNKVLLDLPHTPNNEIFRFINSEDAAIVLKQEIKAGNYIVLKGSRGIALEKIMRGY